jgi:hypothetical protein
MQGKENIRKLLVNFEAEPSPAVWIAIQRSLNHDRKRKRGLWLLSSLMLITAGVFTAMELNRHEVSTAGYSVMEDQALQTAATIESVSHNKNSIVPEEPGNAPEKNIAADRNGKHIPEKSKDITFISVTANSPGADKFIAHKDEKGKIVSAVTKILLQPATIEPGNMRESLSREAETSISAMRSLHAAFPDGSRTLPAVLNGLQVPKHKKTLSRWQLGIYYASGKSYRHYEAGSNNGGDAIDLDEHERALGIFEAGMRVTRDLTPHFAVRIGAGYYTSGVERTKTHITVTGDPGNENYLLSSSIGELTGNGAELNQVLFNDPAVSVLPPVVSAGASDPDNEVVKSFSLEERFGFISVPVSVVYKLSEYRLTPYASLGASINYLAASAFYANEKKIHYSFVDEPKQLSVSPLASLGLSYRMSRHFSIQAEPSFRYSLTSLAANKETAWRPYSWSVAFQLSYRF